MGNASSQPNAGQSGSHTPASGNDARPLSGPAATASASSQPVPTPARPTLPGGALGAAGFHSGITPPARTPSPPCPSTPLLLPHAGHFSPQNPHALSLPQAHDYSKTVVTKLISEGRLAPFYRGFEDWEEDWTEEDVGRILCEVREKDYEEGVENSVTARMKEEREGGAGAVGSVVKKIGIHKGREAKLAEDLDERDRREKKAYLGATECPICFLNYPPNINTSRCCQQPICTECFVQIKRSEPSITHLESEPACCPFCVETDFGVIYERPIELPTSTSESALATSPEASTSAVSQALSMLSEEGELSVGIGMAPKQQETMRRKSVSSKAPEVVLIDQIRPDWEHKLNSVKAAAARRASRRIIMRQVGDRLIPIGYTSSRAPGQADFSMSIGQSGSGSGDDNGSRRRRGGSNRERELEELMIAEAMRLSLVDHEEHLRKMARKSSIGSGSSTPVPQLGESSSRRGSGGFGSSLKPPKEPGTASKFFSKLSSGNRSRAGSTASGKNVSFAAPSPLNPSFPNTERPSPVPGPSASSSGSAGSGVSPGSSNPALATINTVPAPAPISLAPSAPSPTTARTPPASLTPAAPVASAPVTTLANHNTTAAGGTGASSAGLPRISMDMPALTPAKVTESSTKHQEVAGSDSFDDDSVEDQVPTMPSYARLDSGI